jgi:hypothetical protein
VVVGDGETVVGAGVGCAGGRTGLGSVTVGCGVLGSVGVGWVGVGSAGVGSVLDGGGPGGLVVAVVGALVVGCVAGVGSGRGGDHGGLGAVGVALPCVDGNQFVAGPSAGAVRRVGPDRD